MSNMPLLVQPPDSLPPAQSNTRWLIGVIVGGPGIFGLLVIAILIVLLLPAIHAAREAARRSAAVDKLKRIGMAMHFHHDAQDSFPAAELHSPEGQPLHSWRTQILPFMESAIPNEGVDKSRPWNDPANAQLKDSKLTYYDLARRGPTLYTDVQVIVGKETMFPPQGKRLRFRDIIDGSSNTFMAVETCGDTTFWAEPNDLKFATLSMEINGPEGNSIANAAHGPVASVLFADGAVRGVLPEIHPELLHGLITATGRDSSGSYCDGGK